MDYDVDRMLMSDFIQKELILFSRADNVRSIPSLLDGLKPAQRKESAGRLRVLGVLSLCSTRRGGCVF